MDKNTESRSLSTARIGIFSALYVVTSLIPISIFIGAPSFLSLNLIITPIMAILMRPVEAFSASLVGGILGLYIAPGQAMFGPFSIMLPVAGATFGSLAYRKWKNGGIFTGLFLLGSISLYLIKNYPFPYFVIPHLVALGVVVISVVKGMTAVQIKIPLYAYVSTMCEQGMMMIFAVHLLGLPWQLFPGILPIMIYERLVGTIGASLVILGLRRFAPHYFKALNE